VTIRRANEGWKGIPKREVEEMKGKRNGRTVARQLIGWINERTGESSWGNRK
jgi:hypothetical protein